MSRLFIHISYTASLLAILFTSSCTKTMELAPLPQNRITEFKVVNLPDTVIFGAIDPIEKSITVYIPYYYGLAVIDPEIKVSDGARLVEEVLPVNMNETNVSYTVKAKDGGTQVYKLKIVQQNTPDLTVSWLTNRVYNPRTALTIFGDFRATGNGLAKVHLISPKTGKETLLDEGILVTGSGLYQYYLLLETPADIDTGYYKGRVSFLGHVKELPEIHIVYRQPDVLIGSKEVKRGDEIVYTAALETVIVGLKSVNVTIGGIVYDLPIKKYDHTSITLTIPDNFPLGEHHYVPLKILFDNWATLNKSASFTITN
ncbi:hypothetical protein [Pedobacter nyackensis]|uniref:hypothetical protein n=1 Tax=Pedobacter nyackensis TaxID=475255 RepID=UPI00292ED4ED|nr:hypothetical protein [Pedobacter nyackensis]